VKRIEREAEVEARVESRMMEEIERECGEGEEVEVGKEIEITIEKQTQPTPAKLKASPQKQATVPPPVVTILPIEKPAVTIPPPIRDLLKIKYPAGVPDYKIGGEKVKTKSPEKEVAQSKGPSYA